MAVDATSDPTVSAGTKARRIIHKVHDLTPANLNQPNTVIHLHGSLVDPDGMILTTQHMCVIMRMIGFLEIPIKKTES